MASIAPMRLVDVGADVPFFEWKALFAERATEYLAILHETAAAGGFILQTAVTQFEHALASFLGVKHVIGLSDCTNAMLLGLRASDLAPGDEIILPSHAFIAAVQAIHFAGGVPVPVELDETDGLIDPDAVRRAITPRTRGVMPVHVNGRICRMDLLLTIADKFGLELYEDSAQALGATFDGRAGGTFGRWGAFSFYPSKTLGCFGDAGALVTNDDELAAKVRAMRNHGAGPDKAIATDCSIWGTNARLDNLQAAVLAYKLSWYDDAIERRRAIAARYNKAFSRIDALTLPPPPGLDPQHFDIFQNYEVRCDDRGALREHLSSRGIGTIIQWGGTPLHRLRNLGFSGEFARTDRYFEQCLLLPMNHLLSDGQVEAVIAAVEDYFE